VKTTVSPANTPLRGELRVPGDKSISHRALLLGAIALGETAADGFAGSADCMSTMRCLQALGVSITQDGDRIAVQGVGLHGLHEADSVLDAGNSGTTIRLLSGILAGQPFLSVLTGDASLRQRPMERISAPLRQMGAVVLSRAGGRLPLAIMGGALQAIDYAQPVASAQVKSCLLLAGLYTAGRTTISQPAISRDHTERILSAMGVAVGSRGMEVWVDGGQQPRGIEMGIPGDISSAAYMLIAGAIVSGSEITILNVGVNPTRTGILDVLHAMGAEMELINRHIAGGERVADLKVRHSALRGTTISGPMIPRLIDELPILAVAATQALGTTIVQGAAELRVKESDRIATIVSELRAMGASIDERPDGFVLEGPTRLRGASVSSFGDHRLAMSLAVAGLVARGETIIDGADCVDVSWPDFFQSMQHLRG
jgi:3-phosphoshikimate 1-carboxyvinyltransferase